MIGVLRELIKHKLGKFVSFFLIALLMIGATAFTKVLLGWFNYDETQKTAISNSVGEYVGKGLLGLVVLLGFILMARQLVAELRAKRAQPPIPPPIPPDLQNSTIEKNEDRGAS